jgi:hypothetical protein
LSDLTADNQRTDAPPVSVLSLLFLCFASRFRLVIRARNVKFC